MAGRRAVRAIFMVTTGALAAAGCAPARQGEAVRIGTTRASMFGPPAEYRALALRLEDVFERPVVFHAQPDGAAIGTQLSLGEMPFAILSAREFCGIQDRTGVTMLASAKNSLGRTSRKALIVSRSGSELAELTDLKGKRFAFGTRGDLLTDLAVRAAFDKAGMPASALMTELLPPPVAYGGRLYAGGEAANKVAMPILRGDVIPISAGVIDEVAFAALPDTGGNIITGPAKDDFHIMGETAPVPELIVVAGPGAETALTAAMKTYLLDKAGADADVRSQMGISGFAAVDRDSYDLACLLMSYADE